MTDEQLSALLRLKRYEQPPAPYFGQLLRDIQRRQRSELLHRPLWKIAAERVQTFFGEHSMGHLSYAGAMAAVLIVGVGAIGLMTPGGSSSPSAPAFAAVEKNPAPIAEEKILSLQASSAAPGIDTPALSTTPPGFAPVVHQPRYIMDARPVSYEPSSAFNF